jgi:hypothetical protein
MWLMSETNGPERSLEDLARQLLSMNLPSLHSTSNVRFWLLRLQRWTLTFMMQTCTQVLYRLLANPEYIEPLRQEVEAVVAEEGWTKAGMDNMHKIDSLLRESQRFDALGIGLSPFHLGNLVTDSCSSSGFASCRITTIHIFQRRDHPGGCDGCPSSMCHSYGQRNVSEPRAI